MSVNFEFDRLTRTYKPGELVRVNATVSTNETIKYKEIFCAVFCTRTVDPKGHGYAGFDNISNHTPENTLWQQIIPMDWPRTIENGYKFSFDFKVPKERGMTESVRGKYVSVDYYVEMSIKRGMLSSNIVCAKSFFVVYPATEAPPPGDPIEKKMDMRDLKRGTPNVDFEAMIHLESAVCCFRKPPHGSITLVKSRVPVRAITVSYMRTEKIVDRSGQVNNLVSEVCRMQIAENDPPHGVTIPFNLEWVRVMISPDIETPQFSMTIALKVRILFENEGYASTTIPLKLWRDLPY